MNGHVRTHYEVLGVAPDAPTDEIKRAYHARARLYHPDAHAVAEGSVRVEAQRNMQDLNVAWTVLRNTTTRRRYDRSLDRAAGRVSGAGSGRRTDDHDGRASASRQGAGRSPSARPGFGPKDEVLRAHRRKRVESMASIGRGFDDWFGGLGIPNPAGQSTYNLRINGATSLEPLATLAPDRLLTLDVSRSGIGDRDLAHLRDITSLRILDLSGTAVTDVGLLHLQGMAELDSLALWDTAVTDEGLRMVGRLTNLRQLGLGNTGVSDAGLEHLASLRRLSLVQLVGTKVAGPGLVHLHDHPELEIVTLPRRVRGRHRRRLRRAHPGILVD